MKKFALQHGMVVIKNALKWLFWLPRWPVVFFIQLYQKTFSPDHGFLKGLFPHGYCKYHPTCSNYGKESIKKDGLIRGIPKTIWRIIRCNPWSDGGVDNP
jgi:uncharacterized protein